MTLREYLDPRRFPLTTQGISPESQLLIDAFNYDQMREHVEGGGQLSEEQQALYAEFQAKMAEQPRLLRALRARAAE